MAVEDKSDRELLVEMHALLEGVVERGRDHEGRLRTLEIRQWLVYGGSIVIGGVLGGAGLHSLGLG